MTPIEMSKVSIQLQVAGLVIHAMGQSLTTFADMDARLGLKPGTVRRRIGRLIAGNATGARLDEMADLVWAATGRLMQFSIKQIEEPTDDAD